MVTLLTELLMNKYVIGVLGALIGAVVLYFKGKSTARKEIESEQAEAKEEQTEALREAEADNQNESAKRDKLIQSVDVANSLTALIKLFNSLKRPPKDR